MFYLLYDPNKITMCQSLGGWVYAWYFENGEIAGGGRINPEVVTRNLLDRTYDIRKHVNLHFPDQEELEKEFKAWCERWRQGDSRPPPVPGLLAEIPMGKHKPPGGSKFKRPW